jgi:kynurenine formamidase
MDKYKLIDLTHTLKPGIPDWEGCCGFKLDKVSDYKNGARIHNMISHCGIGTHMDAPCHFIPGTSDIASISIDDFVVTAVKLDVREKMSPNYYISAEDIVAFETKYGVIQPQSLVIAYTGWSQFWEVSHRYRNVETDGKMQFPGFSLAAVELLLERNIVGIGIDTLSPDGGDMTFPVHHAVLGAGKYIIENLTNLEYLPCIGAEITALPLKIAGGTEAPCRVIARIYK